MQSIFSGLPAAPGVGVGILYIYNPLPQRSTRTAKMQRKSSPAQEWEQFLIARQHVDEELAHLSQTGSTLLSDIFHVHREILHDKTLTDSLQRAIESGQSAFTATRQAFAEQVQIFQNLSDAYFASRATDIRDVGQRLLAYLDGVSLAQQLDDLPPNTILVADDLTAFDTTHLSVKNVTGIALAGSAPTAHTSILARSLGLPMICALGPAILQLEDGQQAIVDGIQGRLFIEPDEETLHGYQEMQERLRHFRIAAEVHTHEPAITGDGCRVPVRANINSREDVLLVANIGAEGVGLLRTEYLFQQRTTLPSIETQVEAYREIMHYFPGEVFTVRLLDIGGDKPVQYLPQPAEANPFLGVRGVRFLLQESHILQDQLNALVHLAVEEKGKTPIRVLIPMVSKIIEIHRVLAALEQIPNMAEVRYPGGPLQIGIMVEVPAAALLADKFAPLVDFFSIGTNDLSQYTLAADRVNSAVAALASSLDPSVLRLIAMTCEAGEKAGISVGVCGEMAGDPSTIPLLLGLGVTEFSVATPSVALIKHAVRQTKMDPARHLALQALQCSRAQDVQQLLKRFSS
ncbi:MAG: phosphoenolpyruvate--protein phosphotransferase [Caldilineaceae bacterium]|nr:phosphoenolpyruvate--protein phosphotransferase [Caldilineaceae bacterium]